MYSFYNLFETLNRLKQGVDFGVSQTFTINHMQFITPTLPYTTPVPILPPQTALGEQHSDSTAQIVCHFAIVCTVYPFNFPFYSCCYVLWSYFLHCNSIDLLFIVFLPLHIYWKDAGSWYVQLLFLFSKTLSILVSQKTHSTVECFQITVLINSENKPTIVRFSTLSII